MFYIQFEGTRLIEKIKGPIKLGNDNPIFRGLYKLSEVKRALVQAHITKLLDVELVKLLWSEFVLTIIMPTKNMYIWQLD
jgi:hypothetical protein